MAQPVPAEKEDRILFDLPSRSVSVRDVIDAAHFRGDVQEFWDGLLVRLAAEAQGRESEAELDSDALDEAAVAFRYNYDLITAEETEQWLDSRGLTLSEFSEYFARAEWEKAYHGRVKPELAPLVHATPDQRDLLVVELTLSGTLDQMAGRLASRLAGLMSGRAGEFDPESLQTGRDNFRTRLGIASSEVDEWLAAVGRDQNWLEENIEMEAAYRKFCSNLLTTEAREREMSALRLPLTRLEVETIEFDSEDSAREGYLCVRDDGMSMAEVADEGRYPYAQRKVVLEEVPEELQQKFLSLSPGALLEPMAREDGFLLSRLIDKAEPKIDDPDVRARIESRILDRFFADLMSGKVQWRNMCPSSE